LLDEIGDTSPAFQVRLLRVLEEREFQPLGSVEKIKTDVRIIAATHRNLEEMVQLGQFRRDLFYRINIVRLVLPPLRERMEDIALLTDRFVKKMNSKSGRNVTGVVPDAMAMLLSHDYPGNIRELENIIEHAFVLCGDSEIRPEHLPPSLLKNTPIGGMGRSIDEVMNDTLDGAVRSAEEAAILAALERNGYNRQAAATDLGMHKSTLYRKLKKLGITLPQQDGRSFR
jgi:transcriptional regulator with PAS, ATPase and Fis domain